MQCLQSFVALVVLVAVKQAVFALAETVVSAEAELTAAPYNLLIMPTSR